MMNLTELVCDKDTSNLTELVCDKDTSNLTELVWIINNEVNIAGLKKDIRY